MTAEEVIAEVRGLVSLSHAAARSVPRWWTHREIAGICLRAAQWVDVLPRVEGAEPFVFMPVRSRCVPLPITSATVRQILAVANNLHNYLMGHLRAHAAAVVDRGGQLLYDLDGEALGRFPGRAFPEPIVPEHVPGGAMESWLERWAS